MDILLIIRKAAVFMLFGILTACSIAPQPFTVNERLKEAKQAISTLSSPHAAKTETLDYYDALLRSVKCNLDYRIKIANLALEGGQLDVALFAMFPSLNTSGTIYTRSNDYSVSGITSEGIATGLSSSTPRTLRTARVALSWNILDFGMGYVKAKQQSNRVLIAYEESRRQLQQLAQDVLVAYWVAYSIQQLLHETKEFKHLIQSAKYTLDIALHDKLVPKESLLNYQASLLEGDRKLIQLQYKYDKAMLDLKHLLFIPVDKKIVLAPPPAELFRSQDLEDLDLYKMDVVTLIYHPQLRGQNYQERIAKFGLKTVLLQALPGITLNDGWNYDSNKFLLNNKWLDKSIDVAWNLLNLASLPSTYRTAKMQVQYEKIRSIAMTMAALVETRSAYKHYIDLNQEYHLAHQQAENASVLYNLYRAKKSASVASEQQVILAKLKYILAKLDENLLQSDLAVSLGQLYLSVGVDLIPPQVVYAPYFKAKTILRHQLQHDTFVSFIDKKYNRICGSCTPHVYAVREYTIQVAASTDIKKLKAYQASMKSNHLQLAKSTVQRKKYYLLTLGTFTNKNKAISSLQQLPKKLTRFSPWVRRTDDLTRIS